NDDETHGDNDDIDEDDDDDNDENDENIRIEKEKKNVDEGNKEEVGSKNVKDDNVEEGITVVEQKDENVEEEKEKKKVPDDTVWDKTKAIVSFFDEANVAGASNHQMQWRMLEDMTKLPLIYGALKEAAHDVPPVDALEVPDQKVINAAKYKIVQFTKKEVPKKINAKVLVKRRAKVVEVPPDKVVDAAKKKVAAMTQFKQPRPATRIIKDDYQIPKREINGVAQVLEEDLVLSGKRMVNPSFA
ncbi:hypothetical protein Tco_0076883, partial [Tanacetum coccineum]